MTAADDPNGKVTLAVLNNNVVHLTNAVNALREDVCKKQADVEGRLRGVEAWKTTSEERWKQHEKDHVELDIKKWLGDAIALVSAAAIGVFVKPGP